MFGVPQGNGFPVPHGFTIELLRDTQHSEILDLRRVAIAGINAISDLASQRFNARTAHYRYTNPLRGVDIETDSLQDEPGHVAYAGEVCSVMWTIGLTIVKIFETHHNREVVSHSSLAHHLLWHLSIEKFPRSVSISPNAVRRREEKNNTTLTNGGINAVPARFTLQYHWHFRAAGINPLKSLTLFLGYLMEFVGPVEIDSKVSLGVYRTHGIQLVFADTRGTPQAPQMDIRFTVWAVQLMSDQYVLAGRTTGVRCNMMYNNEMLGTVTVNPITSIEAGSTE